MVTLYLLCMHMYVHACTTVPMWRPEDSPQELVLSFHPVDPGDQMQVLRLGKTQCYPLSLAE